jgi:hypothetical protein
MASASRTIIIPASPGPWWCAPLTWPIAQPDAILDYSLDLTAVLADAGGTIASVSVCVAPSGSGELALGSVTVAGNVITVYLGPAPPGRIYTVKVAATTVTPDEFEWSVLLMTSPWFASYPVTPPAYSGFGTSATWSG